jgi:hypothetical protein
MNSDPNSLSWAPPQNQPSAKEEQQLSFSAPTPIAKNPASRAPLMRYEFQKTQWLLGAFVAGIMVGTILGWWWSLTHKPSAGTPSKPAATAVAPATQTFGTLVIDQYQRAGDAVTIQTISVAAPTWVVVYENHDGKPGNALGATLFEPEMHSGTVLLLRPTVAGSSYFVGEQRDDGDKIFSLHADTPVVRQDGSQLLVSFTTL